MVNPDVGSLVKSDGITVGSKNLGDSHVTNDDILGGLDGQPDTDETWGKG